MRRVSLEKEKEIRWVGSAYENLLAFPKDARKEAGFQLGKVQAGLEPSDWKTFDIVGSGTRELRISEERGIFRVM
jgi:phage-related protein